MLDKMEQLLQQDFAQISHYDLMFYSEMSKDLLRLFGPRDEISVKKALRQPDEQPAEEEKKEEVKGEEPVVGADLAKPLDFAAAMKARKASAKKAKDKKKAKKAGKAKAPPARPAAAAAAQAADKPEAPV